MFSAISSPPYVEMGSCCTTSTQPPRPLKKQHTPHPSRKSSTQSQQQFDAAVPPPSTSFLKSFIHSKSGHIIQPEKVPLDSLWKILVCDDSDVCRKSVVRILSADGHITDEAKDGVECVLLAELAVGDGDPYDAVVMDDDMPFLNGPNTTRVLRAKGFHKTVIVGLTGEHREDVLQNYRDCGADFVMRKPLTLTCWRRIYISLRSSGEEGFAASLVGSSKIEKGSA